MEKQIDLKQWAELEHRIREIADCNATDKINAAGSFSHLLFRGQGNHEWYLETTLDRAKPTFTLLSEYYRIAAIVKTQVETFTSRSWQDINYPEMCSYLNEYDRFQSKLLPHYDYFVYLRHHGFPSPLLDWTRSLYIAAFFAFRHTRSDRVAIFMYQEFAGQGKISSSKDPQLCVLGPNVRSDPRHFLQQGEYTLCVRFKDDGWHLDKHTDVFNLNQEGQDRLWKFTLPSSEAPAVMRRLEEYNINAFTLFQSEEALLETLARRCIKEDAR